MNRVDMSKLRPKLTSYRGRGAVGSAFDWQSKGHGFESRRLHLRQILRRYVNMRKLVVISLILAFGVTVGCFAAKSGKKPKGQDPAVTDSLADLEATKYLSVGLDFFKKEQYDEAIEFYNKALTEYPDHYNTIVAMAVTYQKLEDINEMLDWYRKVYSVYPDSLKGYLGLGGAFLKYSSMEPVYLDSALVMYEKGLELFPEESDFYHGVAEVYIRQGNADDADSVFLKGLEQNPENWGLVNAYVDYLMEQDRFSEALPWQEKLVAAQDDDPFALEKLGDLYVELGKLDDAVEAFKKVVEMRPESYTAWIKLGSTQMKQKKYSDAKITFEVVIEQDTTKLLPHLYLGLVYLNWGKEGSAEKEFRYILEKDSEYADAHYYLGVIYVRKSTSAANNGKTKEEWQKGCANSRTATSHLEKAKSIDSRNASRVNSQLEHLKKVRDVLKEKLFLHGITDC